MQIVLSLSIDVNQKKGYLKDSTSYMSLGLNPSTFFLKGYGQLYFNGSLIATGTYGNPLIDLENEYTEYEFDLVTDVNGEVATGVYSVNYYVESQRSSITTSCDATTIYVNYNTAYNSNLWSNPGDIAITISGTGGLRTLTYGQIVSVNDGDGTDIEFEGNVTLLNLASNPRTVTLQFRSLNVAFVYTGCTKVTQDIGFTYDCDTDPTGSWSVYSNTPTPSGVTVGAATGTIEWPSWTGEPNINVSSLPYSNTALATGTYGATISQTVTQVIQSSPLLEVEYTLTDTYEWKVTCAGSLCELNACIESLRAAHEAELLRNKISKYQPYVDNVAIYLHEAQNYKSCGEFDKYRETLAKVKSNLDASGCDCGCCDDNEYKWVAVSPATSTFINNIMSEIQFRVGTTVNRPTTTTSEAGKGLVTGAIYHSTTDDNLYKATVSGTNITWTLYYEPNADYVDEADNGITLVSQPGANKVKLGGNLTETTTIGVLGQQLEFNASTGSTTFTRDYAANSLNLTTPINVRGENGSDYPNSNGPAIAFQTTGAGATYNMGFLGFIWESIDDLKSQFRLFTRSGNTTRWVFLAQADGQLKASQYGSGTFENNTPDYLLGLDGNAIIEVDPLTVGAVTGAVNGLSLVNKNAELGGTLTKNTTVNTSTYDFIVSSATAGDFIINKIAASATAQTTLLTLKETYSQPFDAGSGAIIDFVNDPGQFSYAKIFAKSLDYNSNNTAFIFCVSKDGELASTNDPAFEIYTEGLLYKIRANDYGSGSIINNSVLYLLGVKNDGGIVEVQKSTLGTVTAANNGLTLTSGTVKLGGALTAATTITTTNTETLAIAGLQSGTAASFIAIDGSNKLITATPSVGSSKLFVAKIAQSSTNDPTNATIILNSASLGVTWKYDAAGEYTMSITGLGLGDVGMVSFMPEFTNTSSPVYIVASTVSQAQFKIRAYRINTSSPVAIQALDVINNAIMKIEVY